MYIYVCMCTHIYIFESFCYIPETNNFKSTLFQFSSVQLVAQSCPTLCDPINCSTPGLPVHHQFPEFTQTHIY